jgi:cellulose synthase/poly-beta-1,6-N-acetylglucosamine synthase-like glycosyltransferase
LAPEGITLQPSQRLLIGVYFALWSVFALLGVRRLWMIWLYRRGRDRRYARREWETPPRVTVQLPVYNERYVVRRLIRSVAALDYPRDRLEIQVLDDSDDGTVEAAAEEVRRVREEGIDIVHLRRGNRRGYKAGALDWGTRCAKGDFLLILDADFVPRPEFLKAIVPYFADDRIGMVQVRWDHLNADYSVLSRVQAISLDGHFVVEHEARAKSGLFFNFNGTAGMWRKHCIEDAGGWHHDTLTEDLDLSYRAQLAGWKFVFLRDVTCPAELPVDMRAYKSQQFRWVKGSVQVAKKLLPRIWRSDLPLGKKIESSLHLAHNVSYLFALLLSLLIYPAVLVRFASGWFTSPAAEIPLFFFATMSVVLFYGTAIAGTGRSWLRSARYFPALMSVTIGLSVSNTKAILEGLFGTQTPFHRTPKFDILGRRGTARGKAYRGMRSATTVVELALAAYFVAIEIFALRNGLAWATPFVLLFLCGYLWVGVLSADFPRWRLRRSG